MGSSDHLIVAETHSGAEFETEYSIQSITLPSEFDDDQKSRYTVKTDQIQSLNNELSSSLDENNDKMDSELVASMEKLFKKKRFRYKITAKLRALLSSKKSRKKFNLSHRKSSQDFEYNLAFQSKPTSSSLSSKYFSFLRKLSKNNRFNDKTNSKKLRTIERSIEEFEKSDSRTSRKLNFRSTLLNNICISENVDIQIMESFKTTYNFNEVISAGQNFKRILEILPTKPKLTENSCTKSENFDLLSIEKPINTPNISSDDNSNINANNHININSINALLKKRRSILAKPGKFDEYLKLKFEELEKTRKILNNFLKNSEENHGSLQNYQLKFANTNQRLRMYIQLANKLSEVSFECLISTPSELMCQLVYNKDGVRVWKKEHKSGRVLLRTEFIVPVAPLDYVEYSTDSNNRRVYDNNTVDLKVVENVSPGLDVMYVATKRIATVYPRDIVNIRFLHGFNIKNCFKFMTWDELSNSSTRINQEDVICCSCSCSTEHPDAPERPGYVRMDLSIGSYMAIPIKTPFGIWSSISMFNEASPKGWIPSSVTKMIAAKMVPGSVESIISSMLTFYKFPFKNKVNRPFSGFCYRALSTIYFDQKKFEFSNTQKDPATNSKGINNGTSNLINDSKNNKYNLRLSCLLNKPLMMSIQDFIATYKSNSFQEFIEHFNSVQIINRYISSASSNILSSSNSDSLSSNTDIPNNLKIEVEHFKPIDYNNTDVVRQVYEQCPKFPVYNFSLDKLPKIADISSSNSIDLNKIVLSADESQNLDCNSSIERPSSFEFSETTHIINHKQSQSRSSFFSEGDNNLTFCSQNITIQKRFYNLFINSCKLYQDFGASYLTDVSDITVIARLLSLD
ncbi:uncharacterized protein cubi_00969 [Cryptosporidium ubiquitum]|uniref:START domain-containing protein n=1 Tax=Cryptosporidium ubiquitum TaxID=857276 RepID=A0A1J4M9C9_9CRYT|nr:uncharacterized protein cubi_00969 [Cryptosporidium ubiquitum]OII70824.1 hypothetical protein cubi_00969 [Cryptosporidium ubiquitum]